jgi:hypothetical protein
MKLIKSYIQFESRKRKVVYKNIFDAVSDGDEEYLKQYIKQKKDINVQQHGQSLLMIALKIDFYSGANLLLDNGIDINLVDNFVEENALYFAVNKSMFITVNNDIIMRLIDMGIDITVTTFFNIIDIYKENTINLSIDILYKIIDNGYDLLNNRDVDNNNFWECSDEILFNKVKEKYPNKYKQYLVSLKTKQFNL